jgi:hypothetical protein
MCSGRAACRPAAALKAAACSPGRCRSRAVSTRHAAACLQGETLLLGRSSVLAEDLGLDGRDGVVGLHVQRDCDAAEGADEKLKEDVLDGSHRPLHSSK